MTQLILAYYGDDFTGSTDVMEVLQWSGLRTVLFLDPPSKTQLEEFVDLRAFGVAGWSRSMSPSEMEAELRPAFESLQASGASIVHYKTCSTFDSSPHIGSIGKAIELGGETFKTRPIPIVVGAPNLGRYQIFGTLFARSGLDSEPYRLDRHPTMKHHPITPMDEADLRLHLARQTTTNIGLYDLLQLEQDCLPDLHKYPDADAVLFDVLYPDHLRKIGAAIQQLADTGEPMFAVGSSGIEYALTEFWQQNGRIDSLLSHVPGKPTFPATDQLVVITGSCSPVTERQTNWALRHGFDELAIDTAQLVDEGAAAQQIESVVDGALNRLEQGANLILHSSRGPNDDRVLRTIDALRSQGLSDDEIRLYSGRTLGPSLGKILKGILSKRSFQRVGVAGGDSSGYIARELGLSALEAIAPIAPGSPLCRVFANNPLDGTEFFFKGGQVGKDDVWGTLLWGTEPRN